MPRLHETTLEKNKTLSQYSSEHWQNLRGRMEEAVVGSERVWDAVMPSVKRFFWGLNPAGRPAGVVFLVGPTGVGKTLAVETLAEALHGHKRHVLRVDCGEFQMEHEVAKLIGAPPGYLGHRETQPMLSQQKLNAAASEQCGLSIVLFDEIEKAAESMRRLLLGVLDKASLKLGDNTTMNFERSLIFFTSNVGVREMERGRVGFGEKAAEVRKIGTAALKKAFAPEFVNRLDSVVVMDKLTKATARQIVELEREKYNEFLQERLGTLSAPQVVLTSRAVDAVLEVGEWERYGGREVKRIILARATEGLEEWFGSDQKSRAELSVDWVKGKWVVKVKEEKVLAVGD